MHDTSMTGTPENEPADEKYSWPPNTPDGPGSNVDINARKRKWNRPRNKAAKQARKKNRKK